MRSIHTAAIAALMLGSSALAGGTVDIQSSLAARVYLDGEYVGEAPLRLGQIAAGDHQIQVEDVSTGEVKTYMFHSPSRAHVQKTIHVDFAGPAVVAAPPPPPAQVVYVPPPRRPAPRPVVVSGPVCTTPVASRSWAYRSARSAPPVVRGHPSRRAKAKVHTRNALLGATVASQVFTKSGRDRKRFRNVGLGLTVLNEILR